ncbi:hypothetical protein ACOJUR_11125 [Alicyclobacillus tolerans]|uniref:Uncharacterized protein n=2 Tax=Alicyclobacillus tolerans TaxID=90970 RepID=A0A1M6JQU9_9BACL|nr:MULTISPECIES: hypothetical protein [Alicyclobacillus]MDP9727427.1 putative nucleic acid-binding Zn ribbon protein [Alicyclobacillus tengchongensis]SHJ49067.1 hypothetical protein SAMN05443507_10125 [Alicyclobacillus montanus]
MQPSKNKEKEHQRNLRVLYYIIGLFIILFLGWRVVGFIHQPHWIPH